MSANPNNQPMSEQQWAKHIAKRKSGAAQGPSENLTAAPQQVYDLEVDSSLRGLSQISNNTNFVDEVMEKLAESNADSSANGQVRKRLPTIAPAFERNSDQDISIVPEKDESNIPKEDVSVAPGKCLASTVAEHTHQSFEPEIAKKPSSRRNGFLVIASCLAAAALSAYFLIPIPAEKQTVESQEPPAPKAFFSRVGNSNDERAAEDLASDQSEQPQEQMQDYGSPEEIDSLPDTVAGVEEPSDFRAATGPEQENQHRAARLFASNDQPVERELPAVQDLPEMHDLPAAPDQPVNDDRIIQSNKTWNLVLSCNDEGAGALTINNGLVTDNGALINSKYLIRCIGNEAAKRLAFVQGQIGEQIGGSVTIGNERFSFEAPAEIEKTIERAIVQLNLAPLRTRLSLANSIASKIKRDARKAAEELKRPAMEAYHQALQARAESARTGRIPLELVNLKPPVFLQNLNTGRNFSPQQQAWLSEIKESLFADLRYSPSTDELLVCLDAVIKTESFLRGLAKEKLRWKKQVNRGKVEKDAVASHTRSQEALATESQINDAEFKNFVHNGSKLAPPIEVDNFVTKSLIQHLSGMELKAQLHANSRSYDLFDDVDAFNSAISFVSTNINERRALPKQQQAELFEPLEDILPGRPDLEGLPLAMGDECRLSEEDAKIQTSVSSSIGRVLATFDTFGNRNLGNDTSARRMFVGAAVESCSKKHAKENSSQNLVTLDQMMQIDHTRLVLDVIENLREANTDTAIELLAKRAKFDLRPEVRFSATLALKEAPREKYRDVLLEGFEYPWYVVAQHSAEALVRLDDAEAVPELVELLKEEKSLTSVEEDGKLFQKEVVAVNHLRNCLLCHAPSMSRQDPSRGQVPSWGQPLPREYYHSSRGTFVRADVTYLTQDFSVVQPVEDHGLWPANQRIDYVVYKTPVSEKVAQKNAKKDQNKDHREAIVFALRSLTGETPEDDSWENWNRIADGIN